jgi:rRNA maturation endonuclease Nob1
MNLAAMDFMEQNTTPINSVIETGIVEKGSISDQDLHYTSVDLEFSAFHIINLKLMPVSQRPAEATLYCVECGRRARKKEKFCPSCGTKHNWDGK